MALDFILRQNRNLAAWVRVVVQLLPIGIFVMQLISTVFLYLGTTSLEIFDYLIWLIIALPFFIASWEKEGIKKRMLRALLGTGALIIAYIYLTSQTDALSKNYGATIYFISYFLMLYAASGIKKLSFLGASLGILNAVILLLLRNIPLTTEAKEFGWDYDIFSKVETLIIITFVFCILIRLYEAVQEKKRMLKENNQ
jgi:Mg2+/citrate symporter